MTDTRETLSSLQVQEILTESVARAIEAVKTISIWKVVKVNPNQTVNIECCHLDLIQSALGEITLPNLRGALRQFTTFDPGILVDIPYRVVRSGQFRDMVCPAVGDVGTYTPTYDDMRRWFETGAKVVLPSTMKMEPMHGSGIWQGYIQNNKDTQSDYPTDNSTRIIKSNRTKITINDPVDANGNPTGVESIRIEMGSISITVKGDGTIDMIASGGATISTPKLTVEAAESEFTGNVQVGGNINVGGNAEISGTSTASDHISGGISGKSHTHLITGAAALVPPPAPTPPSGPPVP